MLYCPKCSSTYEDGSQRFCTNDGSRLILTKEKSDETKETRGALQSLLKSYKYKNKVINNASDLAYQEALQKIDDNYRSKIPVLNFNILTDLTEIPPEIGKLTHLELFNAGGFLEKKEIKSLPKEFYNLSQLQHLFLGKTQISEINLENLSKLQTLYLNRTNISNINLENLPQLRSLDLGGTNISNINLENLSQLKTLNLNGTNISNINLENLSQLETLDLRGTKIDLPSDVLDQWENAQYIIKYYKENVYQKKVADLKPLNEVKMLLVGQGRVGKTSLVKYLVHTKDCDPNEPTTHGILREKWKVEIENAANNEKHNIQLNIWDFGGQDIMKSTHQFFLTDKSLYLLVLDAGRDKAGNKLFYWLEKIKSVGEDSPIIIVVNKSEENILDLPITDLKTNYNVKGIFNVSCKDGREIPQLQQCIKNEIGKMSSVFEKIRKEWFFVKEHLENLKEDFISKESYRRICNNHKVTERDSQDVLLKRLNDLGIMLNFDKFETKVLNPVWVTRGVYKVVTSSEVQKNRGILTQSLLKDELEILNDELRRENKDYLCYPPEKYNFITDLMKQFELTYQISDSDNFLIPALLPEDYTLDEDWNANECLRLRYSYDKILLDEGIISKFIVKTQHLSHNQKHWLTGCLLKNDKQNLALVRANIQNSFVDIWVKGNSRTRREFLGIIKAYFDSIHNDKKPTELIPFFDFENEFVNYQDLIALEISGDYEDKKVVQGKTTKYDVRDLLNGYSTKEERQREYSFNIFDNPKSYGNKNPQHLAKLQTEVTKQRKIKESCDKDAKWKGKLFSALILVPIYMILIISIVVSFNYSFTPIGVLLTIGTLFSQQIVSLIKGKEWTLLKVPEQMIDAQKKKLYEKHNFVLEDFEHKEFQLREAESHAKLLND